MSKQLKTAKRNYRILFYAVTLSFLTGMFAGYNGHNKDIMSVFTKKDDSKAQNKVDAILAEITDIGTCFTPPTGCGTVIANQISKAQDSIYVQAYGFTSGEITHALIEAHKRGVKVRVLLDKSNIGGKHSRMRNLRKAGIEVDIDHISGIAHNKVIIIDNQKVITGSFNFTTSADIKNAENVIIINDKQIAARYLQNWLSRKQETKRVQRRR